MIKHIIKFYNKYFRSDKIKTQNGRIYSRKQIKKEMEKYMENDNEEFGEIHHPNINKVTIHRYI